MCPDLHEDTSNLATERRRFRRQEIQCRASVRIGTRHYAAYLHDISRGGAKLRTITPIVKHGSVVLRIPDLPPLACQLRWADLHNAGVVFQLPLMTEQLSMWILSRSGADSCEQDKIENGATFNELPLNLR